MSRALRIMFLGTCRMHDPANSLVGKDGYLVRSTPHRFHTPGQILRLVRHMGGVAPYDPRAAHLISDHAVEEVLVKQRPRPQMLGDLENLRTLWPTFDAFVIEICSLREHFVEPPHGERLIANNFVARDQAAYGDVIARQSLDGASLPVLPVAMERLTPRELLAGMTRIKQLLDRPIVWVCHQSPPSQDEKYTLVKSVRAALAEALGAGAATLGDVFFDPSTLAAQMGQAAFFLKDGEDLDHMTPAAARALGEIYIRLVQQAIQARRSA